MIAASIMAVLLRVLGPDLATVHAELAAALPTDDEVCATPLEEQRYDCPERTRWALTAIADRESPYSFSDGVRWVGRHPRDSGHDAGLWRLGHRRGRAGRRTGALSWWCPAHHDAEGMSTVGPHGMIYLYNVHRLDVPGNCVPWWIFAAPQISAVAALHRYLDLCDEPSSWCPTLPAVVRARNARAARNTRRDPV
jgi:hypothetical protein